MTVEPPVREQVVFDRDRPPRRLPTDAGENSAACSNVFEIEARIASAVEELSPTTVRVITTRYQDAVPFYLEYNFAQVGVTASTPS